MPAVTTARPMELLLKLLHIAFLSVWLAGTLYFPQLLRGYRYEQQQHGEAERQVTLARHLYFGIMTPSAILAVILGTALIFFGFEGGWLPVKLSLVLLLVLFHLYCGRVLLRIEKRALQHGTAFLGALTLVPVPLLIAIVTLAVTKPF